MSVGAILTALLPILLAVFQELVKSGVLGEILQSIFKPEAPKKFIDRKLDEAVAEGDLISLGKANQLILDTQGDSLLSKNELTAMNLLLEDNK